MGVVLPREGFLEGLRDVTRRHGALLVFDEVITGFRLCWGGAQTCWKVRPDLTVLGKIVGGGYPLGAYGGRRGLMERLAPLGPVYQAGTLSGNPVAVAAGAATLEALKACDPYERLSRRTRRLVSALAEEANLAGVPAQAHGVASMFTLFFCRTPIGDYVGAKACDTAAYARFFHAMLDEGVYFPPAQFEAAFLSTAHGDREIELTVAAARRALRLF
jgi:glutamate-1-semialdehyde 2,1-aminomutase